MNNRTTQQPTNGNSSGEADRLSIVARSEGRVQIDVDVLADEMCGAISEEKLRAADMHAAEARTALHGRFGLVHEICRKGEAQGVPTAVISVARTVVVPAN